MNDLRCFLDKNNLAANRITIKNNVKIVDTLDGSFVLKKTKDHLNLLNTYKYLKSRSFDYFPNIILEDNNYLMYEYIEDINEPYEQKITDLINLVAMLHSKTTFYKEVDIDNFKEIYENVNNQIDYLYNYYTDIINIIETSVFMSPCEYLIARNINMIYSSLNYAKDYILKWYEIVSDKRKMRVVNVHNNLSLDHYLKNDRPYLISWEKSNKDIPIYDLFSLYKNHYLDFEFSELFYNYEAKYPLLKEERLLLFSLLAIPNKLEFNDNEFNLCKKARGLFDYLYKTLKLINEYKYNQNPNIE